MILFNEMPRKQKLNSRTIVGGGVTQRLCTCKVIAFLNLYVTGIDNKDISHVCINSVSVGRVPHNFDLFFFSAMLADRGCCRSLKVSWQIQTHTCAVSVHFLFYCYFSKCKNWGFSCSTHFCYRALLADNGQCNQMNETQVCLTSKVIRPVFFVFLSLIHLIRWV